MPRRWRSRGVRPTVNCKRRLRSGARAAATPGQRRSAPAIVARHHDLKAVVVVATHRVSSSHLGRRASASSRAGSFVPTCAIPPVGRRHRAARRAVRRVEIVIGAGVGDEGDLVETAQPGRSRSGGVQSSSAPSGSASGRLASSSNLRPPSAAGIERRDRWNRPDGYPGRLQHGAAAVRPSDKCHTAGRGAGRAASHWAASIASSRRSPEAVTSRSWCRIATQGLEPKLSGRRTTWPALARRTAIARPSTGTDRRPWRPQPAALSRFLATPAASRLTPLGPGTVTRRH